jgi:NTP pyrophosphatase (non-canonical NTP hydrolase)
VNIYQEALKKWGVEAQIRQATEEAAELIVVLNHNWRGRADADLVAAEIADVQIMMEQMAEVFGTEKVVLARREKLERLRERLK